MKTYIFAYDNGQQLVFTATGCSLLSVAINEARTSMPSNASRFRMADGGKYISGWIQ